ncbi:hypothetical protein OEZ85_011493 [Tetradesmus obliquus]|uniref:PKD/Chitinase domain-containing protein n=1 Tax=Tetradesmus obliquus TaxID=3088 RepID=A0ABY8TSR4_TETOB|nr:hypothetical protein OEZ85_011493 [Tetradesmus obliquus]
MEARSRRLLALICFLLVSDSASALFTARPWTGLASKGSASKAEAAAAAAADWIGQMSQSTVVIASPARRQSFPSQSAEGGTVLLDSTGTKAELGGSIKSFTWTITGTGTDNKDFKRVVDGANATVLLPAGSYSVLLLVVASTDTASDSVQRFTVDPFSAPSPSPIPMPKAAEGVIAVDLTKPPGPPPSSPSPPTAVTPPGQQPPPVTPPPAGVTTPTPPPTSTTPPPDTTQPTTPPVSGGTPIPTTPVTPPTGTPTPVTPPPASPPTGDTSGGSTTPPPATTPTPAPPAGDTGGGASDGSGGTGESGGTPTPPPATPPPTPPPQPTPPPEPAPAPAPPPVTPPPTPVTPPPTPVTPPPVVPPPTPVTPPPTPVTPTPAPTPPPAQPPPAIPPPASYERQCFVQDYNMADPDEWDAMKQCCDEAKAQPGAVEPDCNSLPARPGPAAPAAAPTPPPPAATPPPAPAPATPAPTPDKAPDYQCSKGDYDMTDADSWDGFSQCCSDAKTDGYDIGRYFPDCNSIPPRPPPQSN